MANTGFRRRCGGVKRVDVVTVFIAAVLCSASYCLGIWHNSRGAADSRVLGPSTVVIVAPESCGGDEPLDFEARHSAEAAGLSVSSSSSTTNTRRALRGVAPGGTGHGGEFITTWTARGRFAEALDGGTLRFADAGAVRA
ncbi:hypothetical protein QOZ80_2AG0114260 [Eleusine coracana subsp. coracana]|nr:hypothetical protein QOZ80_2AG0114260 [Eleusine coracana subsp. coracana]